MFSLVGLLTIATVIVQIKFALGVKADGESLKFVGRSTMFGEPWVWALAVLIGGLPFLIAYWVVHHWNRSPLSTQSVQASHDI